MAKRGEKQAGFIGKIYFSYTLLNSALKNRSSSHQVRAGLVSIL